MIQVRRACCMLRTSLVSWYQVTYGCMWNATSCCNHILTYTSRQLSNCLTMLHTDQTWHEFYHTNYPWAELMNVWINYRYILFPFTFRMSNPIQWRNFLVLWKSLAMNKVIPNNICRSSENVSFGTRTYPILRMQIIVYLQHGCIHLIHNWSLHLMIPNVFV